MTSTDTPRPGTHRALLLIDFQYDFLADDGRMPVARDQVGPVLAAARAAIGRARRDSDLIVAIGNEFRRGDWLRNLSRRNAAVAGSAGARWDPRVDVPDAAYLPKWKSDAFSNPGLRRLLAERGIGELDLAGLYAQACITATARSALASGYRVTILADAVACRSESTRQAALKRLARLGAQLAGDATAAER